jgi:2-methylcitrate dehydratase PrpD
MLKALLEVEDQTNTVALVAALAEYAATAVVESDSAIGAARHLLVDALARGFEALRQPERVSLIGPLVPGAVMPGGARVPGTSLELDPAQAAFCNGMMLCRPAGADYWQELGGGLVHDSLGAILAIADYQARKASMEGKSPPKVRDVLAAIVKAAQIQGVLAFEAGYRPTGTGTLRITRVTTTAVVTSQLGGTLPQIIKALSYASVDGGMLIDADERFDIGRRDWALADAISRAVRHACQAVADGSSYLTVVELEAVDLAGKFLGARHSAAKKRFGAGTIDRLAGLPRPYQVAELATRFPSAIDRYFPARQAERIKALFAAPERLDDLPVNELLAFLVTNGAR